MGRACRFLLACLPVFGYRPDVAYEGNFVSVFVLGVILVPVFALVAVYAYVGVGFWRLHRDDFTRLSVYILTHQAGLIANFSASRPKLFRQMNALALDALSFPRVAKVVLLWPVFLSRFREVLEFARFSSRVLGDERTDALAGRLSGVGFAQADPDDVKSSDRFKEGFLVRRLDDELVAVFWHEGSRPAAPTGPAGEHRMLPRNVVPLRVPAERRVRAIAQLFQRWGLYSHVAEGFARSKAGKPLPYVVVYEPYSLGRSPRLHAFKKLLQADVHTLLRRVRGDSWQPGSESHRTAKRHPLGASLDSSEFDSFGMAGVGGAGAGAGDSLGFGSDQERDEAEWAMRAERAYQRFLLATQTFSRNETPAH